MSDDEELSPLELEGLSLVDLKLLCRKLGKTDGWEAKVRRDEVGVWLP